MMKLAEIQAACGVLCVDLAAVVDNYQTLARHVALSPPRNAAQY